MTIQLTPFTNSPAVNSFTFNDIDEEVDTSSESSPEIPIAELPAAPTTELSIADVDVFGGSSGSHGLGPLYPSAPLVSCEDCGKAVPATALQEHAVNCQKIRNGGSKDKTEEGSASPSGSDRSGKKRKASDALAGDGAEPPKKKKYPKNKSGVPGGKGSRTKGPLDPDKQCGVFIEKKGTYCTRSITCKVHAMRDKRAVPGRSRPYDELVTAYKKLLDPAYEEPPKKETKAERKEKKEKEKAEKRRKEMIEKGLDPDAPPPAKGSSSKDAAGGSKDKDASGTSGVLGPDGEPIPPKKKKSSKKKKDASAAGAGKDGEAAGTSTKDGSGKGGEAGASGNGEGGTGKSTANGNAGGNAANATANGEEEDEDFDSEAEADALIEAVQRARGLPPPLSFAPSSTAGAFNLGLASTSSASHSHSHSHSQLSQLPPSTPITAVNGTSFSHAHSFSAVVPYAYALGQPLARPLGASSFFVTRNEVLRTCSDIVRNALGGGANSGVGVGVGVGGVGGGSGALSMPGMGVGVGVGGPSSAGPIATPRSGASW